MCDALSGATGLYPILGDPIAQVKSPAGVTRRLRERGVDGVCVPIHVVPGDLAQVIAALRAIRNVGGFILTVPHKIAAVAACDELSARARLLGAVNTIRRGADGRLVGDMFDGLSFLAAARAAGCVFEGRRALLVGAGGAGAAIAHAVLAAGLARLEIADTDIERREGLARRLGEAGLPAHAIAVPGTGYDIVVNATPLGMRAGDPLPVPRSLLGPGVFVGDVVTKPEIPPLIAAARAAGARTSTGTEMFEQVAGLMVDFMLAGG
jgi:shikimate dehydrogenase